MKAAVIGSARLPLAEKPAFIGHYLIAAHKGQQYSGSTTLTAADRAALLAEAPELLLYAAGSA